MARGLSRHGHTPREAVRDRRNAQRMAGAASLMFGGALAVDSSGTIVLNLQTLSGLDQDTTGLTVVVQDVLAIDAAGLKLTFGTGLQSDGTTLTTKDSEIVHADLSGYVANEHIDHTSVTITTGVGLSGGGDISANRTFDLDILGLTTDTIAAGDWVPFHDLADEANKIAFSDFEATLAHGNLAGYVANEHIDHTSVTITTGVGISGGGDISSDRTFDLNILGLTTDTIAAGDWVPFHDLTDEANKLTFANFEGTLDHDNLASVHQDVNTTASPEFVAVDLTDETAAIKIDGGTVYKQLAVSTTLCLGPLTGTPSGAENLLVGWQAGADVGAGIRNMFLGAKAGFENTGSSNVGVGFASNYHTSGSGNVCIGTLAGRFNAGDHTGNYNMCIGYFAGWNMQGTASDNTCMGRNAGLNVSGNNNVCLGYGAGDTNPLSGSFNIYVGRDCKPVDGSLNNVIAFGTGCRPTADHQCLLGSAAADRHIDNFYLGAGVVDSSSIDITVQVAGGAGTNNAAGDFIIAGGKSTGNADPGDIIFKTSVVGAAGAALQTLATAMIIDGSQNVSIGSAAPTLPLDVRAKSGMTAIGGFAIKLTNKTGANSVAGQLVKADPATNDAVILTAVSDDECIGVFLDSGIADGSETWVVVAGIADVAMEDNTAATRGNWVETSDTIGEEGYADATAATPAAAPAHFEEIGHCIETVAAGGGGTHILARCVLHFN